MPSITVGQQPSTSSPYTPSPLLTTASNTWVLVEVGLYPQRRAAAAAINVTAWMGLSTLAMLWLSAGEGALVVYTMPIWATKMIVILVFCSRATTKMGITMVITIPCSACLCSSPN